ncbi:MAG: hypothetical protein HY684_04355 [Chloroflexi bacterium]|nr:hypothetical protein [Chloroflexota bacterium]
MSGETAELIFGALIFGVALAVGGVWFWACAHLTQAWYDQKKVHMPRWLLLTLTFGYAAAQSDKEKERSLKSSGGLRWLAYGLGVVLPLFVLAATAWRFFAIKRLDINDLQYVVLAVVTLGLWLGFTALVRSSVEG